MADLLTIGSLIFGGGGVLTAIGSWRKNKLDEAQILSNISAAIREEIREENTALRERLEEVMDAVIDLTNLLDDLMPKMTGLSPEERLALRYRLNRLKRVT
jgi:hypothetical protein